MNIHLVKRHEKWDKFIYFKQDNVTPNNTHIKCNTSISIYPSQLDKLFSKLSKNKVTDGWDDKGINHYDRHTEIKAQDLKDDFLNLVVKKSTPTGYEFRCVGVAIKSNDLKSRPSNIEIRYHHGIETENEIVLNLHISPGGKRDTVTKAYKKIGRIAQEFKSDVSGLEAIKKVNMNNRKQHRYRVAPGKESQLAYEQYQSAQALTSGNTTTPLPTPPASQSSQLPPVPSFFGQGQQGAPTTTTTTTTTTSRSISSSPSGSGSE